MNEINQRMKRAIGTSTTPTWRVWAFVGGVLGLGYYWYKEGWNLPPRFKKAEDQIEAEIKSTQAVPKSGVPKGTA